MIHMFVPTRIKNYYIRPQYILGLDVTKYFVYGSLLYYKGYKIIIEKTFQEVIDQDSKNSYTERASQAIQKIITQIPYNTWIISALSSSVAACKELTLPFTDQEKIALVINFEIEPDLPFALNNCIIDYIVTHQNIQTKQTTVLVAAVQKKFINEHLEIFNHIHVSPYKLSLDLFDLYGLYKAIPQKNIEPVVLIDLDYHMTRSAFIINNELKAIRTLNKGIAHIAKAVAHDSAITTTQALEELLRFGIDNHEKDKIHKNLQKYLQPYLQDIKITLQSFASLSKGTQPIKNIILLGVGSELHEINKIFIEQLNIPCQLFEIGQIAHIPHLTIKNGLAISRAQLISLATAYQNEPIQNFNLLKNEYVPEQSRTVKISLFIGIGLSLFIFFMLIGSGLWNRYTLKNFIKKIEHDVVKKLHTTDLSSTHNFNKAIDEAQDKVDQEERLWFAFSRQQRFSFLQTLQNLSMTIDRKSLGLKLKKLILTNQEVILEGEVKGFEELKILERELKKSNMFVQVPPLQDLKFNEKLMLKKNGDHHATT